MYIKVLLSMLKSNMKSERGIALPMALTCIMIVTILVMEFSFTHEISKNLAYNDYEILRAEYLAKSGINISLLKLKIHKTVVDLLKNQPEIANQILNFPIAYPIPKLAIMQSEDEPQIEDDKDGRFLATVSGVSGMNLNQVLDDELLYGENPEKGREVYLSNIEKFREKMLSTFDSRLDSSREGDDFFYRKYRDVNFNEILSNIIDWVDRDSEKQDGGYEDDWYKSQDPPYKSKNSYFDTFNELYLVEGMTDDLLDLFKGQYCVYSEGSILISELINIPNLMKWLSKPELDDKEIEEIREEFSKPETTWNSKVDDFEKHIRETYKVAFNDNSKENPHTNYIKLSDGSDINRFFIKSTGVFKRTTRTIETYVDRSSDRHVVFLYYNYF